MTDKVRLYFDSHCVLCKTWVKILLSLDSGKRLFFIALQSDYSKKHLPSDFQNLKTIVLDADGHFYTKSTAVIKAMAKVNPLFISFYLFFLLPKKVRDFFYDWLAKNRYKWFGKSNVDDIINDSNRDRFLL